MNKLFEGYATEHAIDIQILRLKKQLLKCEDYDEDYENTEAALVNLIKLRDSDVGEKSNHDNLIGTVISSAVGVVSMGMILGYEKTDIVTSKAFSIAQRFIGK